MKLVLSEDGQSLKVTEVTEEHNHEISKVSGLKLCQHTSVHSLCCVVLQDIYEHLPCQRRLDESEQKQAQGMLKMKVNKKLLQQHLTEVTGKIVTLKDITNIQTGVVQSEGNDIKALVNRLEAMEGHC